MIVLKAAQNKILATLASVAWVVERRHTLPILANTLIGKAGFGANQAIAPAPRLRETKVVASRGELALKQRHVGGFFSVVKVNLRNAP